jgi:hypothetical protein
MTVCASSNIKPKWKPKAIRVTQVGYSKNHSSNTYIVLKHHNNEYVESCDIQWDEPRRYRKLSLEATRGEAVKHTPTTTLENVPTNHFAALISDNEAEDNNKDGDSDNDDGSGAVAGAQQPAAMVGQQQQQQGGPRLQQELHWLARHNINPVSSNSNNT